MKKLIAIVLTIFSLLSLVGSPPVLAAHDAGNIGQGGCTWGNYTVFAISPEGRLYVFVVWDCR